MNEEVLEEFGLPELPPLIDPCDTDENTRELVLYRFAKQNIPIGYVTEEDAQCYCQRDDTHKRGEWFVGYRTPWKREERTTNESGS